MGRIGCPSGSGIATMCAVHSSPPFVALYAHRFLFAALRAHSLGVLGSPSPISHPGVYDLYAPYHKRSLMARASLFFDDQVQSLAHTHVGPSPTAGPLFCVLLLLTLFLHLVALVSRALFDDIACCMHSWIDIFARVKAVRYRRRSALPVGL